MAQTYEIRNERKEVTTYTTEIEQIVRDCHDLITGQLNGQPKRTG